MAMGLLYIPVLFLKDLQLLDSTQRKKMCHILKKNGNHFQGQNPLF